jgi:ribonuclease P protein component
MISYLGKEEIKYEEMYAKMTMLLTLFVAETKKKTDAPI